MCGRIPHPAPLYSEMFGRDTISFPRLSPTTLLEVLMADYRSLLVLILNLMLTHYTHFPLIVFHYSLSFIDSLKITSFVNPTNR